ncbi:MAG: hypothetical protein LC642_06910 [Verrucomicrobiaceae bacterium]|nr:hypothetical protein [Verrucomicrobiaceae bacterium]
MRRYTSHGQTIEVEFRPFGIFLWLLAGFVVRVGGRTFYPELIRARFMTSTEFELESDGQRIRGVVRSLAPMLFLPRMRYAVSVADHEIARDTQILKRWYLSFISFIILLVVLLLALVGALGFISVLRSSKPSNQAMQLTASTPAVYAGDVCRRERMLRGTHRGLAVADLVSR